MSILESPRHKLPNVDGFTLMTPSLYGWEAFPTPEALTHIRIIWAPSPMAPQVSGCHFGDPLVLMVLRALLIEKCATIHVRGEIPHTLSTSMTKNLRALSKGVQLSVLVNTYNIHFGLSSNDRTKKIIQLIPYAMWKKYMPCILKHTLRRFCKNIH